MKQDPVELGGCRSETHPPPQRPNYRTFCVSDANDGTNAGSDGMKDANDVTAVGAAERRVPRIFMFRSISFKKNFNKFKMINLKNLPARDGNPG